MNGSSYDVVSKTVVNYVEMADASLLEMIFVLAEHETREIMCCAVTCCEDFYRSVDELDARRIAQGDVAMYENLRKLWLAEWMTDSDIVKMTRITELYCQDNCKITNVGIEQMVNLEVLDCGVNQNITDDGVKKMVRMKKLVCNEMITDDGVREMREMRQLTGGHITDNGIENMNMLRVLVGPVVTDYGIRKLVNLEVFDCSMCDGVSDYGIAGMTKMRKLQCNDAITNEGIKHMARMEELSIPLCRVSDAGIENMVMMRHLHCSEEITDRGIRKMRRMHTLFGNSKITKDGIIRMLRGKTHDDTKILERASDIVSSIFMRSENGDMKPVYQLMAHHGQDIFGKLF